MRIPPYWARATHTAPDRQGHEVSFSASGWSFDSMQDAQNAAATRAKRVYERMILGQKPGEYEYLDVPLREEIVDTLNIGGVDEAIITRNRYGALVLNAQRVCFVDIDDPPKPFAFLGGFISKLFGGGKGGDSPEDKTLARIREWAQRNPGRGFVTYRTHAGYRLLFTDKLYDPNVPEARQLLSELESDALYQKLCEKQKCFRARLTPKPWRIGAVDPAKKALVYPFASDEKSAAFAKWREDYEKKSQGYAVCQRIEETGPPPTIETIKAVIAIHDLHTCNGSPKLA